MKPAFYIYLHSQQPGQRAATVIETARKTVGAKRMARILARERFGDPLFVRDQGSVIGGHWRENDEDGATKGERITVMAAMDDIH